MAGPGGSTAQSGFYFQNSIAALYLARMIGKPDERDSQAIIEVTNEASSETIKVDDILVKYRDHHRTFIQAKENINIADETWKELWRNVLCQILEDFQADEDRIVLYLGNKNTAFYALKELCKRASGKDSSSQWKITNKNHRQIFTNIKNIICSLRNEFTTIENNQQGDGQSKKVPGWNTEWNNKSDDDLAVTILSKVNVEIITTDQFISDGPLKMPISTVESSILFRVLRDYAAESAIYNEPVEAHNFRKKLRDELHITIRGTESYVFKDFEPLTILIDDGKEFLMGDDNYPNESPRHSISLDSYRIGKYPVSNREFAVYVNAIGTFNISNLGWRTNQPSDDKLDQPVTGVTFLEVRDYCEWLSRESGHNYRLPNEAEWEKAARGNDGRKYPWGNDWDKQKIEKENKSIYGCCNMVGNVFEWTCSLWGNNWREPDDAYKYEWKPDRRNDPYAYNDIRRVIRGGPLEEETEEPHCSRRGQDTIKSRGTENGRYGFRVMMEVS
jgi:hypothetical protein